MQVYSSCGKRKQQQLYMTLILNLTARLHLVPTESYGSLLNGRENIHNN